MGGVVRIVVGLPSNEAELREHIVHPEGRDLFQSSQSTVQQYRREVMLPLQRSMAGWRKLGAKVYGRATRDVLAQVACAENTEALILFSHWCDTRLPSIELAEGLCEVSKVVEVFPTEWSGVMDLCVCQSRPLALQVAARCPDITVKWIDAPALPVVWMSIYTVALMMMRDHELSYLDAMSASLRSHGDAADH